MNTKWQMILFHVYSFQESCDLLSILILAEMSACDILHNSVFSFYYSTNYQNPFLLLDTNGLAFRHGFAYFRYVLYYSIV